MRTRPPTPDRLPLIASIATMAWSMRPVSRRAILAGFPAAALRAAGRGTRLDAPRVKFADGLTGREMFRLTDPAVLHHLPDCRHRCLARDNSFLLLAAEHSGERQIYRLDLKRRRLTQLTDGPGVHPYSPHLSRNGRSFFYLQDNALHETSTRGGARKTHFQCPDDWIFTGDLGVSADDALAAVVEMRAAHWQPAPERQFAARPRCRIRIVPLAPRAAAGRGARVAVEERRRLTAPQFRPNRPQLLYAGEGPAEKTANRLCLIGLDGKGKKNLRPATKDERISAECWSRGGARIRYVHYPGAADRRATIRSLDPDTLDETVDSPCSAFGWFCENADGSAIVGAGRRLSGPNIYVLFPHLQREITLCEHFSSRKPWPLAGTNRSDPRAALPDPVISANSEWIYFVTDREGKPAIYAAQLGDLVEPT